MARELAFAFINPYTIAKSRTGGVIARFIARTQLDLVGARMFAPSQALADEYADLLRSRDTDANSRELLSDYVRTNYAPNPQTGRHRRVMMLLFEGENAVEKVWKVTGSATLRYGSGETIRDTYGDYVLDVDGNVQYFEPAVLVSPNATRAALTLRLWAKYAERDGGMITTAADVPEGAEVERTLVLLKPDNFRFSSARPGSIIDILSTSGLRIVGAKRLRMSVKQAESFYGPVVESLSDKFEHIGTDRAVEVLSKEFKFDVPKAPVRELCRELGSTFAEAQFESIVEFMTGHRPGDCREDEKSAKASETCLALAYEGINAVKIIRSILGPTDPSKANPGSVRREFGSNIMVNAAHASDSPDNARREMAIVDFEKDDVRPLIDGYYGGTMSKLLKKDNVQMKNGTDRDSLVVPRVANIQPSLTLSITSRAKAMKAEGETVFSFAAGEPDFDTPVHIKQAAISALEAGETKYAPASGILQLRQTIADKLAADNSLSYAPEQVIVNCGAKHSLYNVFMAICDTGHEVIIPAPFWLSYPEMVQLAGAKPVIVPCDEALAFKLQPAELEAAITPATRAVVLNSPSNPIGVVYTEAEIRALVDVALKHDLLIVSDEIYEKILYDGAKHFSAAACSDEALARTITVNGFSKAYSMTGWRLGYLAAPLPIAKAIGAMQSHSTSGPTTFAEYGAIEALVGSQDCITEMVTAFTKRRAFMYERLAAIDGISCVKPMGAFYMLPNIAKLGFDSLTFCKRLLEEQGVAAVPGAAFGADDNIRLSYACSMENIEQGLDRLDAFAKSLA